MDTLYFTPINLTDGIYETPQLSPSHYQHSEDSWQYTETQYNFLQSSLSSDLKIQNLDEDIINNPSAKGKIVPIKPESDHQSSKKRKRPEEQSDDISFVKLTREQLLVMSSQELEERVKLLQQQRPLTAAENEEIKRQRKLIKNREYAHTSRLKKRETLSTLKVQLTEVSNEKEILKNQVSQLTLRVQQLEMENQQLRNLLTTNLSVPSVQQSPIAMTPVFPSSPSSPESCNYSDVGSPSISTDEYDQFLGTLTSDSDDTSLSLEMMNDIEIQMSPQSPEQYSIPLFSPKAWGFTEGYTGICLLVILFSFGLFFNGIPGMNFSDSNKHFSRSTVSRTLFDQEEVDIPDTTLIFLAGRPVFKTEQQNLLFPKSDSNVCINTTTATRFKQNEIFDKVENVEGDID